MNLFLTKKGEPYACILYYQERRASLLQKDAKMSIQQIGMQAAAGATSSALGIVDELLMGNRRRKKQLEQQQKLTDQQVEANKQLALHNKELEFDLWNKTNYKAQVEHMKAAGLNPALMYNQAGQGVTGTAGQAAGGAHASDEAAMQEASIKSAGMALQLGLQKAQIENIKADTKEKEATANNLKAKTETENEQRDKLVGKLKQEGVYYWLQNEYNKIKLSAGESNELEMVRDKLLDEAIGINAESWAKREIANALLKTAAETSNLNANALLASERAKIVWEELLVAQKNADANEIKAKAQELAINWGTGEYNNWKTWADLAANSLKSITSVIK